MAKFLPGDVAIHNGIDHGQMGEAFSGHLQVGVLRLEL